MWQRGVVRRLGRVLTPLSAETTTSWRVRVAGVLGSVVPQVDTKSFLLPSNHPTANNWWPCTFALSATSFWESHEFPLIALETFYGLF